MSLDNQDYSLREELANSVTHGIGTALSIAALSVLVTFSALQDDVLRIVSFSVYGTSLILLYLFSTLYHSFQTPGIKRFFRMLDHSAIFLLIAGTYTPLSLVIFRGVWGWSIFGVIWGLALTGIILNSFFMQRFKVQLLVLYVLMGWIVVVAVKPLVDNFAPEGIAWLIGGGVFYTFGVLFYLWHRIPYHHAIWHLFVLGGSICHFLAMLFYVLPVQAAI